MNTKKIPYFLCLLLLGVSLNAWSQHGIGTNTPNPNAVLELTSPDSDKGFLAPRVALTSSSTLFTGVTATASDTGLLVYNTSTTSSTASGLQGSGFYFWNGTYWERFTTSTENNLVTSLDCHAATISGTVISGEAANLTVSLPYSGGVGIGYAGETTISSGIELGMTGLTGTLQAGTLANGTGILTYAITGTATESGDAYFGVDFGGESCVLVVTVTNSSSGGTAVVSNWDCSGTATGTLYRGEEAAGVRKTVYADVTKAGTYDISITNNGITYSANGTFAATGNNIAVTLQATGTPIAAGTTSFTLFEPSPASCSFEVEVLDRSSGGTATVSSYDCNGTATGSMTVGTALTEGAVSHQITANVSTTGTYDISAVANGVTFTASGTFAGTGSQPITLTATGTPTAMGTHTFTPSTTPDCSFDRETSAQPSSGGSAVVSNWTCDGADTGTLTKGMAVVGVTKIITATVSEVGSFNITAYSSGVTYTGMGTFAGTGAQSVLLTASGTPTVSGLTTYTLSTTPNCEFTRTVIDLSTGGTASVDNWDCAAGTSSGTLYRNEDTTGDGIYKTIEGNVTQMGTYNFTAAANGVTYTASGTFTILGSQTVTLTATGTPADTGTHAYALSTTPSCTFDLTTIDRSSGGTAILKFKCAVMAETGTVTATEAVVGVTQEIQASVTKAGTYSITTDQVNGITFANSGTLASTGTQSITLLATGTATAGGASTYTLNTTPACSFTRETVNAASVACDANGIEGNYIKGKLLTMANKFSVTVTNGDAVNDLVLSLANTDISLSGAGAAGISAGVTSPSTSITIAGGASATIEYDLTGTPTSLGNLIIDWAINTLSCTQSRTIAPGDATFTDATNNIYTFSVNDTSIPLNEQGTFISGTTKDLAYTEGVGTYAAYTSPDQPINAAYAEDGASDWTFSYSYAAGTFTASGVLEVTYTTKKAGVETDFQALRVGNITTTNFDFVNLPLMVNGNTKPNTIGLDEGGDTIRGGIANGGNASGAAYDAANVDDIVQITLAEYNAMDGIVPGSVTAGKADLTDGFFGLGANTWVQNGNGSYYKNHIANSYIYAVAFASYDNSLTVTMRWGVAPSLDSAVTPINNFTTGLTVTRNLYYYFVTKRPSTHSGASTLFVFGSNAAMGGLSVAAGDNRYTFSIPSASGIPTPTTPDLNYFTPLVQYKYSTQKSW